MVADIISRIGLDRFNNALMAFTTPQFINNINTCYYLSINFRLYTDATELLRQEYELVSDSINAFRIIYGIHYNEQVFIGLPRLRFNSYYEYLGSFAQSCDSLKNALLSYLRIVPANVVLAMQEFNNLLVALLRFKWQNFISRPELLLEVNL